MIVREISLKDGVRTERLVNYKTGEEVDCLPQQTRNAKAPTVSSTNGFIGNAATLANEKKMDAQHGCSAQYVEVASSLGPDGTKNSAYRLAFEGRDERNKWLRSRQRVDLDAGYGDPCPGDFGGPRTGEE